VAVKEGRTTILSVRLLIIASILALAVLAATYAIGPGFGGGPSAPSRLVYGFTYYPDLDHSRPALASFVASISGAPLSDVEVELVSFNETFGGPVEFVLLDQKTTDSTGWARFESLSGSYPDMQLALRLAEEPDSPFAFVFTGTEPFPPEPLPNRGMLDSRIFSLSPDRLLLSLVFIDTRGTPIGDAAVYIWTLPEDFRGDPFHEGPPEGWDPYLNGTTDASGFYIRPDPLTSGDYVVRVEKGELNATTSFGFSSSPSPFGAGPDGVLAFSGILFLPLIVPMMAMVLAYGAIARERSEGSLDLLLSKPVSRVGVALGKLTGVFGSMALPVIIILLAAAAIIWVSTGTPPTGSFVATFIAEALLLLLIYTLLFLAVSANVRSLGTALLISILLFLLFAFFWGIISFVVAGVLAPPGSVRWFEAIVVMSLGSPTGVYQQFLSLSVSGFLGGFLGVVSPTAQEVPLAWILTAAVLWIALPLVLFLWAMKYRVTER
jgi:ABC-2 type transport system permease protein